MSERDEHIQDKERKVYDLKKRNQELEKFKFVLDYKIKELKEQVEPREAHISALADEIQGINRKLETLNKQRIDFESQIKTDQEKLVQARAQVIKEHRRKQNTARHVSTFKSDLEELMFYFQDHHALKKVAANFYEKYCRNRKEIRIDAEDANLEKELANQHQALQNRVRFLRAAADKRLVSYRLSSAQSINENQELIRQIQELRGNF